MAKENELEKEAIPEARRWKLDVLERLNTAIDHQYNLHSLMGLGVTNKTILFRYQGSIIALYNHLKPKLKKNELKFLKDLDEYRQGDSFEPLSLEYLNRCFDVLNKAIERIGITKVEVEKEDAYHLFKRA